MADAFYAAGQGVVAYALYGPRAVTVVTLIGPAGPGVSFSRAVDPHPPRIEVRIALPQVATIPIAIWTAGVRTAAGSVAEGRYRIERDDRTDLCGDDAREARLVFAFGTPRGREDGLRVAESMAALEIPPNRIVQNYGEMMAAADALLEERWEQVVAVSERLARQEQIGGEEFDAILEEVAQGVATIARRSARRHAAARPGDAAAQAREAAIAEDPHDIWLTVEEVEAFAGTLRERGCVVNSFQLLDPGLGGAFASACVARARAVARALKREEAYEAIEATLDTRAWA
jgi:hypothetical protein